MGFFVIIFCMFLCMAEFVHAMLKFCTHCFNESIIVLISKFRYIINQSLLGSCLVESGLVLQSPFLCRSSVLVNLKYMKGCSNTYLYCYCRGNDKIQNVMHLVE